MKKHEQRKNVVNRRDFLKIASIGVAAAGMVPALAREAKADVKKLKFTFACSPYDRLQALINGAVQVEGVELNFLPLEVEETFWRQLRYQEFDGSELSFSSYILARSRGDDRFIALPVFTSRVFRHSSVYINTKKGIARPEDLKGKTVGVPEYQMTAALWLRGLFQHEYGVYPRDIKWRSGGQEMPGREEKLTLKLPPDIDYAAIPRNKTLSQMLDAGQIDALFTALAPSCFTNGSPNVKRLWENYKDVEGEYYRKTGIFPIMHGVALKRSVYKENPWVAQSLYKALVASKNIALENLKQNGVLYAALPWLVPEVERTRKIMGEDWWPYGIDKNRKTIEAMCQYSYEQGLAEKLMKIEDLFAPETFTEFKR
jgi:4,5-dihydroxyphthalate decarboxylase